MMSLPLGDAPAAPLLTLSGISKSFPGVRALSGVNLQLYPGQVTALIGENGAGKSTIVKILMVFISLTKAKLPSRPTPFALPPPMQRHVPALRLSIRKPSYLMN